MKQVLLLSSVYMWRNKAQIGWAPSLRSLSSWEPKLAPEPESMGCRTCVSCHCIARHFLWANNCAACLMLTSDNTSRLSPQDLLGLPGSTRDWGRTMKRIHFYVTKIPVWSQKHPFWIIHNYQPLVRPATRALLYKVSVKRKWCSYFKAFYIARCFNIESVASSLQGKFPSITGYIANEISKRIHSRPLWYPKLKLLRNVGEIVSIY